MSRTLGIARGTLAVTLVVVTGGAAAFASSQSHVTVYHTPEKAALPRTPSTFPSWITTAAASGVAGIGVQGWGPGAGGIYVRYLCL